MRKANCEAFNRSEIFENVIMHLDDVMHWLACAETDDVELCESLMDRLEWFEGSIEMLQAMRGSGAGEKNQSLIM